MKCGWKWYTSPLGGRLWATVCFTTIFLQPQTGSVPDNGSSTGLRPRLRMTIVQGRTLCQPTDTWHEQEINLPCFKLLRLWDGDRSIPSPSGLKESLSPLHQPASGPSWKYHQVIISTCWFYSLILFPLCTPLQTPREQGLCLPSFWKRAQCKSLGKYLLIKPPVPCT